MEPVTALHSRLQVPMRKWILTANRGEEIKEHGCTRPFLVNKVLVMKFLVIQPMACPV